MRTDSAWQQTGFVFTTELGEACNPRNALWALEVAAAEAGLPDMGPRTLRQTPSGNSQGPSDSSDTTPELRFPLAADRDSEPATP